MAEPTTIAGSSVPTATYNNPYTSYLSLTNSLGVVTGQPSVPTTQPALSPSQTSPSSIVTQSASESSALPATIIRTVTSDGVAITTGPSSGSTLSVSTSSSATSPPGNSSLDVNGKIGLGVGLGVGIPILIALIAIAVLLFRSSRRQGRGNGNVEFAEQGMSKQEPAYTPATELIPASKSDLETGTARRLELPESDGLSKSPHELDAAGRNT